MAPDSTLESPTAQNVDPKRHAHLLARVVSVYDSFVIRSYCRARFVIININILHILALCIRGKRRVLDIGCGFGLFGCYFASIFPDIQYFGYDLNPRRIEMANAAARRLGLDNATFALGDARSLDLDKEFDAVLMLDLMHHIDDPSKLELIETLVQHLAPDGRLVIKDVTTHPFHEIAFTWALDVVMTQSFDMWYWDENRFSTALRKHFDRIDLFPIADWLPYPHIVYLCDGLKERDVRPK